MDLNKVILIGNTTAEPEVRTTTEGSQMAKILLATNRHWTDPNGLKKEQAEFHTVIAWKKLAEIVGQYVKKGAKLYIEGRIQTRSWDNEAGVKQFRTEIIAENIIMLDKREV